MHGGKRVSLMWCVNSPDMLLHLQAGNGIVTFLINESFIFY